MGKRRSRIALAGHFHLGCGPLERDGMTFHASPALCEAPFAFDLLRTDGVELTVERHAVQAP